MPDRSLAARVHPVPALSDVLRRARLWVLLSPLVHRRHAPAVARFEALATSEPESGVATWLHIAADFIGRGITGVF